MPGQGPDRATIAVSDSLTDNELTAPKFAIIPVTPDTISQIGGPVKVGFAGSLSARKTGNTDASIQAGDRLTVRVWESSPEGLFSTVDQKSSAIPVVVSGDGNINIPYVGNIVVSGMTVGQVRAQIADRLRGKAVDPEVSVILESKGAQSMTVVGDARAPGRFDIPASGLRVLDAVALASGASNATHDVEISLVRGSSVARARLDEVITNNAANVWLQPRDTLQLLHSPRSFSAFGAVRKPSQQPFETERVTLAEAIAKVGGLNDNLADDSGVFVFRFEKAERVKSTGAKMPEKSYPLGVPTIYWLNLSSPESIFMSQAFTMRDKDVLYVANAPAAELKKFTSLVLTSFRGF